MKKTAAVMAAILILLQCCTPKTTVYIPSANTGGVDTIAVKNNRLIRQ